MGLCAAGSCLPPGGLGCGAISGLQHPRAAWAGGVGPLPRALCAAGTRLWLWQPLFRSTRLCAACQAFSLGCPAVLALGSRGAGEAQKQVLLVDVLAGCFPPLGPPWARFFADRCGDVAFSRAGPKPRQTRDGHSWRMGPCFSLCPRVPRSSSSATRCRGWCRGKGCRGGCGLRPDSTFPRFPPQGACGCGAF